MVIYCSAPPLPKSGDFQYNPTTPLFKSSFSILTPSKIHAPQPGHPSCPRTLHPNHRRPLRVSNDAPEQF